MPHEERLAEARAEYSAIKQDLEQYIRESAEARVAWVRAGSITQSLSAVSAEMALAGAHGQIQTVAHLAGIAEALVHAEATLHLRESEDYQERFRDSTPVFQSTLPAD